MQALHRSNLLPITALQKVFSALKEVHQRRVQVAQLCIAPKAATEKVHGGHKNNKAVAVELELAVAVAVAVAEEIIRAPDLN
jgi:hypothetical protein